MALVLAASRSNSSPEPRSGHAPAEVALHDAPGDAVDGLDPAQRPEAGEHPAHDGERQGQRGGQAEAPHDLLLDVDHVAEVARDREELAARQALAERLERMLLPSRRGDHRGGGHVLPARPEQPGRERAGEAPTAGILEQVAEAIGASGVPSRPQRADEFVEPVAAPLIDQRRELGRDGRAELRLGVAGEIEVDRGEEDHGGRREEPGLYQG